MVLNLTPCFELFHRSRLPTKTARRLHQTLPKEKSMSLTLFLQGVRQYAHECRLN